MKCLYGQQRACKHEEEYNITALEVFVEVANKHIAELSKSKKIWERSTRKSVLWVTQEEQQMDLYKYK